MEPPARGGGPRPRRLPRRDGDRHGVGEEHGIPRSRAPASLVTGAEAPNGRGATALYLSPTKALAADQVARLGALAIPGLRSATYDGDTPQEERRWIRDHAQLVLTNPDLVTLAPRPARGRPSRGLRYVVVDECHVYRGVFGSHVAALLRRLRRVAARYGAEPTFVLASATVRDPRRTRVVWSACPCARWSGTARPAKP